MNDKIKNHIKLQESEDFQKLSDSTKLSLISMNEYNLAAIKNPSVIMIETAILSKNYMILEYVSERPELYKKLTNEFLLKIFSRIQAATSDLFKGNGLFNVLMRGNFSQTVHLKFLLKLGYFKGITEKQTSLIYSKLTKRSLLYLINRRSSFFGAMIQELNYEEAMFGLIKGSDYTKHIKKLENNKNMSEEEKLKIYLLDIKSFNENNWDNEEIKLPYKIKSIASNDYPNAEKEIQEKLNILNLLKVP